jgi:hypothetical protein
VDVVVITILQGGMRKDEGKGGKRDGEGGWPFKPLPPDRMPCSWTVELLHSSKERGKAKNPVER